MNENILSFVHRQLIVAKKFNLETEIVAYALKFMKENSKLTIEESILMAMDKFNI